jgi:quercetin dioxygenase-like cupin family protein
MVAVDPDRRRSLMRRLIVLLSVVIAVQAGGPALAARLGAGAQDATPSSAEAGPEGGTFDAVALAFGVDVASPIDMVVVRIGLEPGAAFPIEDSDPTTGILVVESGTLTVRVNAVVTVTRGTGLAGTLPPADGGGGDLPSTEEIAGGELVTLEAGDTAFIPGNVSGEISNGGDERAVGLAFLVGPSEGPVSDATPSP